MKTPSVLSLIFVYLELTIKLFDFSKHSLTLLQLIFVRLYGVGDDNQFSKQNKIIIILIIIYNIHPGLFLTDNSQFDTFWEIP